MVENLFRFNIKLVLGPVTTTNGSTISALIISGWKFLHTYKVENLQVLSMTILNVNVFK